MSAFLVVEIANRFVRDLLSCERCRMVITIEESEAESDR
jgi:hypothetical protein